VKYLIADDHIQNTRVMAVRLTAMNLGASVSVYCYLNFKCSLYWNSSYFCVRNWRVPEDTIITCFTSTIHQILLR